MLTCYDTAKNEMSRILKREDLLPKEGFGKIILVVQDGKVVLIERRETFK